MKRKLAAALLILITLFQAGCWDIREINEIGIVEAVGIDFSVDTSKYTVTVQAANSKESAASNKKGGSSESVWIGSSEGSTIFEAVRNMARISSKRIVWSHNTIVILGEPFVKNDITPAIDFFTHNPELRMKTAVAVSKGDAKNYIASKAGLENLAGISLAEMAGYSVLPAVSIRTEMLTLNSEFSSDYSQLLIMGIDFKKSVLTSDDNNNISENNTIALEGAAVFKKNKVIGWLSPEESRGLAWVLNKTKSTLVTVSNNNTEVDSETEKKNVSIETRNVKTKIISEIVDDVPNITISLTGEGLIVEQDVPSSLSIAEFQDSIASSLNKEISDEIERGIDKVQKYYESDVLGFAQIVRVQNNEAWKRLLKDEWQETFPIIPIKIDVNFRIKSNTLKQEPLKETKGK